MDGSGLAQFIPLILIFVIFYFFLIRPQQKRVKDHKAMVESLKRGDEIITSGGIIGTIDKVMEDDRIEVLIGDNVKVQIIKSTITSLLKKEEQEQLFVLNFSKINILIIYLIFTLISLFSILNFQSQSLIDKKVNLGLDLQGGSYLLLEINSDPLVKERIQSKVIPLKKILKENNLNYSNFKIEDKKLSFKTENIEKFELIFFSKKDNSFNPYINKYNSFELDLISKENGRMEVSFSKYGLLTLNNSALKQSIEIVRRRIDDVGTKEPTILQRGEKRILVELPGLKDPERIKSLLGKTAQLNFRLVTENEEFGSEQLISESGENLNVSKRVVMSGEN